MRLPEFLRQLEDPSIVVGERVLPLVIRRLPHAQRFTLRLAPDGSEVRLSMPRAARTADALAFAGTHTSWLAGQLAKVPDGQLLRPGEAFPFRGEPLVVLHDPAAPRRPAMSDGAIRLGGPEESLPRRLRQWLEAEARRLLREDLADYCALAGKPLPRLALSAANRRWGSCSARGNIRINWRLVMAPDWVRRSVVAHEVAHLVHFDHSREFHALLARLYEGDLAAANAWLKREGRTLYAPFG